MCAVLKLVEISRSRHGQMNWSADLGGNMGHRQGVVTWTETNAATDDAKETCQGRPLKFVSGTYSEGLWLLDEPRYLTYSLVILSSICSHLLDSSNMNVISSRLETQKSTHDKGHGQGHLTNCKAHCYLQENAAPTSAVRTTTR